MKLRLKQTGTDFYGKPLFDVTFGESVVGQVYYNMRGFVGYFKLPHKPDTGFQLGGGLSRVRQDLRAFEKEYCQ